MFELLMKLFGFTPPAPPKAEKKTLTPYETGPPRDSYTSFLENEELPVEEFLLHTHPAPQANNASGSYYANRRAELEAEEVYHFQLLDASVDFITRLNAWNLRKNNRTTAEIDIHNAMDMGGFAGTIDQAVLEEAAKQAEIEGRR